MRYTFAHIIDMKYKWLILLIVFVIIGSMVWVIRCRLVQNNDTTNRQSIAIAGKNRTYLLDTAQNPEYLVIALHGNKSTGKRLKETLRLENNIENTSFALAYPDGIDSEWQDIRSKNTEVDDTAFITEITQKLQTNYNISPQKTIILGVSNGGFMAQTIVCEKPQLFYSLISIVASVLVETAASCKSLPQNVQYHLARNDSVIPYRGGMLDTPNGGTVLSAKESFEVAGNIKKCAKETQNFHVFSYERCEMGTVKLYSYDREGHISLPLQNDWKQVISEIIKS
jgi:poly(3-hydroxybutyrate) depolymerase